LFRSQEIFEPRRDSERLVVFRTALFLIEMKLLLEIALIQLLDRRPELLAVGFANCCWVTA